MPDATSLDHVQMVMEKDVALYKNVDLTRFEQRLLRRFKTSWPQLAMLDVGVGAGRTSFTFSAIAGSYLGIDISPMMVELARALAGDGDDVSFRVMDVCDVGMLQERFDLVLFSWNSIDLLDRDRRHVALRQMRAVTKPGGFVAFSTHNLHSLRSYLRFGPLKGLPRELSLQTLYRVAPSTIQSLRLLARKRTLDLDQIEAAGWTRFADGVHNFAIPLYYVSMNEQLRELDDAGLSVVEICDPNGDILDPRFPGTKPHFSFLCTPTAD